MRESNLYIISYPNQSEIIYKFCLLHVCLGATMKIASMSQLILEIFLDKVPPFIKTEQII